MPDWLPTLQAIGRALAAGGESRVVLQDALHVLCRQPGLNAATVILSGDDPLTLRVASPRRIARPDTSLVSVPIVVDRAPIGALEIERLPRGRASRDETVEVIDIVASMIAQFLRAHPRHTAVAADPHQDLYALCESAPIATLKRNIRTVAAGRAIVYITGEPGTGRLGVARAIHGASALASAPFVVLDAASTSQLDWLERVERATLFLDELAGVDPDLQERLLRLNRLRLIAATCRVAERKPEAGLLRADLYNRIYTLAVPPLRAHKEDLPTLAAHLLGSSSRELAASATGIEQESIEMLTAYRWPGNLRELSNVIEHAVLACDGATLSARHFPMSFVAAAGARLPLKETVAAVEQALLASALAQARGNCAQAARMLRTTERVVAYKTRTLGIDPLTFRTEHRG